MRLLVHGTLIVPDQRILLIVLLGAVSDCSRIGIRSGFIEYLVRYLKSPSGLVSVVAVAGCHVSLSLLLDAADSKQ